MCRLSRARRSPRPWCRSGRAPPRQSGWCRPTGRNRRLPAPRGGPRGHAPHIDRSKCIGTKKEASLPRGAACRRRTHPVLDDRGAHAVFISHQNGEQLLRYASILRMRHNRVTQKVTGSARALFALREDHRRRLDLPPRGNPKDVVMKTTTGRLSLPCPCRPWRLEADYFNGGSFS